MSDPLFALPFKLTNVNHLRVTYADASTDDVNLYDASVSGWYNVYSLTAWSLPVQVSAELNAQANSKGTAWGVSDPTSGLTHRTTIGWSGGSSNVTKIEFLTDELTSRDLGFTTSPGSPDEVSLSGGGATGTYQRRYVWDPRSLLLQDTPKDIVWAPQARSRTTSTAYLFPLGKVVDRMWRIAPVQAALVHSRHLSVSGYVSNVAGLNASDPNVSWDVFMDDMRSLTDATTRAQTTIRTWKSQDALSTFEDMMLSGQPQVEDWDAVVSEFNAGPKLYELNLSLRET